MEILNHEKSIWNNQRRYNIENQKHEQGIWSNVNMHNSRVRSNIINKLLSYDVPITKLEFE